MEDPVAQPIRSVDELTRWEPNPFDINRCTLPKATRPSPQAPKVLVCHDMMGGYIPTQDGRVQSGPPAFQGPIYSLRSWQYVDIFVYFTHERFGIPPSCWTYACHRNAVAVFATFITEWEAGTTETMRLIYGPSYSPNKSTEHCDFSPFYADKMVDLALFYGFEGWFVNVESPLISAYDAEVMARFISYLTEQMHERVPNGQVFWYDSLTRNGKIQWQDRLNDENKMFFDACDGIFLNYTWAKEYPQQSHDAAQGKHAKVYVGIDCWGRNTYGGGGFNAHKALRVIRDANVSVAIFAPAWTYEALGTKSFELNDFRFWVSSHVEPDGPHSDPNTGILPATSVDQSDKGCIADIIQARPAATIKINDSFAFYTTFDQGHGTKYFISGVCVSQTQWSHLARQSIQPTLREFYTRYNSVAWFEKEDAFHGGTSLHIKTSGPTTIPLFGISIEECTRDFVCVMHVKNLQGTSSSIAVSFLLANSDWLKISCNPKSDQQPLTNGYKRCIFEFPTDTKPDMLNHAEMHLTIQSDDTHDVIVSDVYIGSRANNPSMLRHSTPKVIEIVDKNARSSDAWVTLRWTMDGSECSRYEMYIDGEWKGTAYLNMFRIRAEFARCYKVQVKAFDHFGNSIGGIEDEVTIDGI